MAAIEPPRKRPTTFTIESIVGRSTPSPSKPSPSPATSHGDHSGPQGPARKSVSEAGSVTASTSASAVSGTTSAGRHLELLARFAAPSLTGGGAGLLSTSGVLGGGNGGAVNLAETLLRAGGHLPYAAAAELVNRANGFATPAATPTIQGQASTVNGAGPAALTLFRGSIWNPQDLARRIPSQGWSASLVHPLTTAVRPPANHMYMQNPYVGEDL